MEVNEVDVVIAQETMTSFSDNMNNKFFKFMEEKFYDNLMLEPQVKDAFKYMIGLPILDHDNNEQKNTLTLKLIVRMEPKDATYWKLKYN